MSENERILAGLRGAVEWMEVNPDEEVIGVQNKAPGAIDLQIWEPKNIGGWEFAKTFDNYHHFVKWATPNLSLTHVVHIGSAGE